MIKYSQETVKGKIKGGDMGKGGRVEDNKIM